MCEWGRKHTCVQGDHSLSRIFWSPAGTLLKKRKKKEKIVGEGANFFYLFDGFRQFFAKMALCSAKIALFSAKMAIIFLIFLFPFRLQTRRKKWVFFTKMAGFPPKMVGIPFKMAGLPAVWHVYLFIFLNYPATLTVHIYWKKHITAEILLCFLYVVVIFLSKIYDIHDIYFLNFFNYILG